jgi:SPFH domain / Band 7 family
MFAWIVANKEWFLSGIGVTVPLVIVGWWLQQRSSSASQSQHGSRNSVNVQVGKPHQSTTSTDQDGASSGAPNVVPEKWQGIVPPQSRYDFVTESTDSIPVGLQSFSFEYGPQGHAKALTLKGAIVRADIQFTCRIVNPYKAIYGANEYALNVLKPRFLSHARDILERLSLTRLRAGRQEVARDIVSQLSPQFKELGVRLESVTIGALDQIEKVSKESSSKRRSVQTITMTKKKIFLASSSELKEDRKEFEIFINRKNKDWVALGAFIELIVWEDFLDAVSKTRLQDEYNKAIRECNIFVMLFFTKVGQYTEEEFETAFGQFKTTNKPFIFTYFKDAAISTGRANKKDLMSLWAFQEKLDALGHFYTVYKNIDELKFKFNQQLDKLAANGFIELKPDKGEAAPPNGINIRDSKNVIAGSKLGTGSGDVIVGDRNTTNK